MSFHRKEAEVVPLERRLKELRDEQASLRSALMLRRRFPAVMERRRAKRSRAEQRRRKRTGGNWR